ncbi:hypothetical protein AAJV73_08350 [Cyanobium sp. BSA11S]|uniref:hypothetical protein n=1 Tax=Cyanobium sp. BSA11S TaxID=3108224 RepID=UPI003D81B2FF
MSDESGGWLCAQIGAREHYAVARALHRQGQLHQLLTDCWVPPHSPWPGSPRPAASPAATTLTWPPPVCVLPACAAWPLSSLAACQAPPAAGPAPSRAIPGFSAGPASG